MTTELKVMVGVPGSGKSTWIEQEVASWKMITAPLV